MLYRLCYKIKIGGFEVKTLKSVKISNSVENLADFATIELPGKYFNDWKSLEKEIKIGDEVEIFLGYNDELKSEFKGFVKRISRENSTIAIECEDALFLLDKAVGDKEYKKITLERLLLDVLRQADAKLKLKCDFSLTFDKFVTFKTTALEVLKTVHEQTRANIYFDGETLFLRPIYADNVSASAVKFDTERNVQSNDLKWKDARDRKVEIEVICTKPDGSKLSQKFGNDGGTKQIKHVTTSNFAEMKRIAESEYNLWNFSGYEGDFTAWLIPKVNAGDAVELSDPDTGKGKYYCTGVEIEFGTAGAKRKISLGRRLN